LDPQAVEYRIEYTPYTGNIGMFLNINGKFSMGNRNRLLCEVSFFKSSVFCSNKVIFSVVIGRIS